MAIISLFHNIFVPNFAVILILVCSIHRGDDFSFLCFYGSKWVYEKTELYARSFNKSETRLGNSGSALIVTGPRSLELQKPQAFAVAIN